MHDKRKALETIIEKLGKLLPHLGNANDGEALAAVRAITALLKKAGLDWHDLVMLLHGNEPSLREMLARLVENEADALVRLGRAGATFFCLIEQGLSNRRIAKALGLTLGQVINKLRRLGLKTRNAAPGSRPRIATEPFPSRV